MWSAGCWVTSVQGTVCNGEARLGQDMTDFIY